MSKGGIVGKDDFGQGKGRLSINHIGERIAAAGRPPILDDHEIWSDQPAVRTDADAARYWAAKHGEALQAIQDLRSDLSGARFERDIWWPLAFAVGLLCGAGLTWWM